MAKAEVFRCQFLSIFVERCPRCFQPVFDVFSFLFLERDFLPEISCTVSFRQDLDFDVADRDLFFFDFTLSWLLSIFVLSGWVPRPTTSVLVLNSQSISRSFSNDVEKSSTSSANLRFVKQSSVLSLNLMPFRFSCHFFRSFSSEYCNTVLKNQEDNGSPCFVPRLMGNASLSLSVRTVPSCWL